MRTLILTAMLAVIPGSISPVCQAQEPTITARPVAESKQAVGDPEQMRASIKQLTT
jgi:hypothetical protein